MVFESNKSLGAEWASCGVFFFFFSQRFWLVVGDLVKAEVKRVFVEKKIPDSLKKTLIALILKMQGFETIGNYMPISLYNMVYKVFMKIIVARLRHFLSNLVSPL